MTPSVSTAPRLLDRAAAVEEGRTRRPPRAYPRPRPVEAETLEVDQDQMGEPGRGSAIRDVHLIAEPGGQLPVTVGHGYGAGFQEPPELFMRDRTRAEADPEERSEPGNHPGIHRDDPAVIATRVQCRALGNLVACAAHADREKADEISLAHSGEIRSR